MSNTDLSFWGALCIVVSKGFESLGSNAKAIGAFLGNWWWAFVLFGMLVMGIWKGLKLDMRRESRMWRYGESFVNSASTTDFNKFSEIWSELTKCFFSSLESFCNGLGFIGKIIHFFIVIAKIILSCFLILILCLLAFLVCSLSKLLCGSSTAPGAAARVVPDDLPRLLQERACGLINSDEFDELYTQYVKFAVTDPVKSNGSVITTENKKTLCDSKPVNQYVFGMFTGLVPTKDVKRSNLDASAKRSNMDASAKSS